MNTLETIQYLCDKNGISIAKLERDLGYGNGSLKKANSIKNSRLEEIASYFDVSVEYLITGQDTEKVSSSGKKYFFDDATAAKAQELFDDPNLRMLFDAARNSRPEDLQMAADMLKRFKETNPNG